MRRTRTNLRKAIRAVALSFAALAVYTGTASAMVGDHAASPSPTEIPYLSHGQGVEPSTLGDDAPGGVTPTNLARAYEAPFEGVAVPDGSQPARGGADPLISRDGSPDGLVPQLPPGEVVSVSASSDGYDRDDVAIGFGLGLILATACAAALAAASGRQRMAHS